MCTKISKFMTKDQVLGLLRHVLTFGGGFMVTNGIFDEAGLSQAIGAVITLAGAVWSILDKKKAA